MNPILNILGNRMMQSQVNPVQPVQPQAQTVNRNAILASAFQAAMSGKSPQEFLRTLPQLQNADLSNIQSLAQSICASRGINYEQAKAQLSNQLSNIGGVK